MALKGFRKYPDNKHAFFKISGFHREPFLGAGYANGAVSSVILLLLLPFLTIFPLSFQNPSIHPDLKFSLFERVFISNIWVAKGSEDLHSMRTKEYGRMFVSIPLDQ
jgi:hypothetical protein